MKILSTALVALSLLALVGCGKNEAVEAAEQMADAVCKCEDLGCATAAMSEGSDRLMKLAKTARGTESDGKKILAATERASDCVERLRAAP